MAANRKITISGVTQTTIGDLTAAGTFADNSHQIRVALSYTAEHTSRTFIRVSIHLAGADPDENGADKRHKKGDLMFAKNFRVTGGGGAAVNLNCDIPGNKINLDYDHSVYVIHVRERDGFAAATRNIARAA